MLRIHHAGKCRVSPYERQGHGGMEAWSRPSAAKGLMRSPGEPSDEGGGRGACCVAEGKGKAPGRERHGWEAYRLLRPAFRRVQGLCPVVVVERAVRREPSGRDERGLAVRKTALARLAARMAPSVVPEAAGAGLRCSSSANSTTLAATHWPARRGCACLFADARSLPNIHTPLAADCVDGDESSRGPAEKREEGREQRGERAIAPTLLEYITVLIPPPTLPAPEALPDAR